MTDAQCIHAVLSGDIAAYSHIVDTYSPQITGYVRSHLFQKLDTDDIVQMVFIKFYRSLSHFDPSRPVLPFLYAIASNELKMYYRSHAHDPAQLDESSSAQAADDRQTMASVPSWDDTIAATDIGALLETLPPDQRDALRLYAEGYEYADIADRMHKPLNTIRTLIRRGRQRLTKLYNSE